MVSLGERESLLFFDDTYELKVYNLNSKEIAGTIPWSSNQIKCIYIAESKLFIGLAIGEIVMYDAFTLEKLDKVAMNRNATPNTITLQCGGTLLVGMLNGTVEIFSFAQRTITQANRMNNEIKVPFAGEIYSIHVSEDIHADIALATFSGLFFGKFEIGPLGRPY